MQSESVLREISFGWSAGHNAVLHATTVEDNSLVGMGATLLDGSKVSFLVSGWSQGGEGELKQQTPPRPSYASIDPPTVKFRRQLLCLLTERWGRAGELPEDRRRSVI